MNVDYNKIAGGFSKSRKNMKWEEIDYFIDKYFNDNIKSVLDIGCGSGRLLEQFSNTVNISNFDYLGLDLSSDMLKHAEGNFPQKEFLCLNMLELDKLEGRKFDFIFFIASFHHLDKMEDRITALKKVKNLLNTNGKIFFTNWSLNSEVHTDKYSKDIVENSKNKFGSLDYSILFGDYARYYHGFDLSELEYLFKETGFEIIENREFDNKRNFISIIKKIGD